MEIEPKLGDPIPETWVKQAEQELKTKHRIIAVEEFKGEKNVELHIHQPNPGDDSIAANAYSKVYNRLLKDREMLTKSQIKGIIEERELWGEKEEQQIENWRSEMKGIESDVAHLRIKKNYNKATVARFRSEWVGLKQKIQDKITERENYYSNSIENRAEEEQLKVKLSLCVKYPDGRRVWNSLDELNNDSEKNAVIYILNNAILFWMGLTQEIIDELPTSLIFGREDESES